MDSFECRNIMSMSKSLKVNIFCSEQVNSNYKILYTSMSEQYHRLLRHVRSLVYNGDTDMACNFLGDQWFVESLKQKVPLFIFKLAFNITCLL